MVAGMLAPVGGNNLTDAADSVWPAATRIRYCRATRAEQRLPGALLQSWTWHVGLRLCCCWTNCGASCGDSRASVSQGLYDHGIAL